MPSSISRRDQLKTLGLAAVGMAAGTKPLLAVDSAVKRVLRIAQITDVHVQPELGAGEGLRQCLKHIHALTDRPDLILNTGDSVMDCMGHDADRCKVIWDLWQSILASECKIPMHHVLGNHDVWGWNKKQSHTTGQESGWGKAMAMDRLGLTRTYYSFDAGGWHLIALDAIQPHDDSYLAGLDDAQFNWLQQDLAATDARTPVLIFSHVPILSAAALMKDDIAQKDSFIIPGGKMLLDNIHIKNLWKTHTNIRLCLSGHIHLLDRVDYMKITYLCNGAVCGNYWKDNSHGECEPGYSLIDLFADGTSAYQYVPYGWVFQIG